MTMTLASVAGLHTAIARASMESAAANSAPEPAHKLNWMDFMASYAAPFSEREYGARVGKVRSKMAERGLDLLICQDPANM